MIKKMICRSFFLILVLTSGIPLFFTGGSIVKTSTAAIMDYHANEIGELPSETDSVIKIINPRSGDTIHRDSRFRYQIEIEDPLSSDPVTPFDILLTITFLPENGDSTIDDLKIFDENEHPRLTMIREKSCFSCHSDKSRMLGPSFFEIFERYGAGTSAIETVNSSIKNGASQKWSNQEMPAYSELAEDDLLAISSFILNQGSDSRSRIVTGAEGVLSVAELVESGSRGHLVFSASYVDRKGQRFTDSVLTDLR